MAKITEHGGPTDAAQDDVDHPAYMSEDSWPGISGSQSKQRQGSTPATSATEDQAPAPTTENPSKPDRTENFTARSTDGSTKAVRSNKK